MKKILFLSALDFKEKSIQVIRKTPEAYAAAGWDVDYIVARDVKNGNYSYEQKITPAKLRIGYKRLENFRGLFKANRVFLNKLAVDAIVELCLRAKKFMKTKQYDVIYGYDIMVCCCIL